ncbi:MAG: hypothetical protein KatS3mg014_2335 [Actinomycetota bacterium]|nr:MAG: hypothetical protein KatS3mg014_2335 [Actinomycetota bacterium]
MSTRRNPRSLAIALVAALLAVACRGGGERNPPTTPPPPVSPVSPDPSVSVTPPALPEEPPPTRGPATPDCVNGWITPPEDSPRYRQPLGIIRRTTGVRGPLVVVDMRYFEGPESPPSDKGYLLVVQRWYIKLYAERDPAFQGRFLVEARRFGRGVAAVAPYDSHGFRSPDWIGFQWDSADPEPKAYPGLPGRWSGIPYDFVRGGAGLDIPGLPEQVVGCLDGT